MSNNKEDPPLDFICPITCELMKNPVVARDGHTYEKKAIMEWFKRCDKNIRSPKTGATCNSTRLTPNYTVLSMISTWKEAQIQQKQNAIASKNESWYSKLLRLKSDVMNNPIDFQLMDRMKNCSPNLVCFTVTGFTVCLTTGYYFMALSVLFAVGCVVLEPEFSNARLAQAVKVISDNLLFSTGTVLVISLASTLLHAWFRLGIVLMVCLFLSIQSGLLPVHLTNHLRKMVFYIVFMIMTLSGLQWDVSLGQTSVRVFTILIGYHLSTSISLGSDRIHLIPILLSACGSVMVIHLGFDGYMSNLFQLSWFLQVGSRILRLDDDLKSYAYDVFYYRNIFLTLAVCALLVIASSWPGLFFTSRISIVVDALVLLADRYPSSTVVGHPALRAAFLLSLMTTIASASTRTFSITNLVMLKSLLMEVVPYLGSEVPYDQTDMSMDAPSDSSCPPIPGEVVFIYFPVHIRMLRVYSMTHGKKETDIFLRYINTRVIVQSYDAQRSVCSVVQHALTEELPHFEVPLSNIRRITAGGK